MSQNGKALQQLIDFSAVSKKMVSAGMSKEAVQRELSFANQIVFKDAYLQKCTKNSLLAAVVNVANIGLTLNPAAQQAYIIARYNGRTKEYEATLMPGYRGFLRLLVESGGIKHLIANLVYEKDEFDFEPTDDARPVRHKPYLRKDKGVLIGGYALATMPDGSKIAEWMPIEDINAIRDNSDSYKRAKEKGYNSSPWIAHYSEMCRKTLVRRIQKYLPTTNNERLFQALENDNKDHSASWNQLEYIDRLLHGANIRPELNDMISRKIKEYGAYTFEEAKEVIEMLQANQVETDGDRWNQKKLDNNIANAVQNESKWLTKLL